MKTTAGNQKSPQTTDPASPTAQARLQPMVQLENELATAAIDGMDNAVDRLHRMPASRQDAGVNFLRRRYGSANVENALARLQRSAEPVVGSHDAVPGDLQSEIASKRGSGKALDESTRGQMESSFGSDFSDVRVHTGSDATRLNEQVQAEAFTVGSDIFFKGSNYKPGSSSGKHLLAHELTHVVQHGGAARKVSDQAQYDSIDAESESAAPVDRAADSELSGISAVDSPPASDYDTRTETTNGVVDDLEIDLSLALGSQMQVSAPTDSSEVDAERTAESVMRGLDRQTSEPATMSGPDQDGSLQRFTAPKSFVPHSPTSPQNWVHPPDSITPSIVSQVGPVLYRVSAPPEKKEEDQKSDESDSPEQASKDSTSATGPSDETGDSGDDSEANGEQAPKSDSTGDSATTPVPPASDSSPSKAGLGEDGAPGGTAAAGAGGGSGSAPESGAGESSSTTETAPSTGLASGGAEGGGGGTGSPKSAEEHPAFQAVKGNLESTADAEKSHVPAAGAASAAQAAAVGPANEVPSKAAASQVEQMAGQVPGKFDRGAFKAALMEKIKATAPKTLSEADQFSSNSGLDSVTSALTSTTKEGTEKAEGAIESKTKEAPDTSSVEPKPTTPLPSTEVGNGPQPVATDGAIPKPKGPEEAAEPFVAEAKTMDQQMAEAELTDEQLEKANESSFSAALDAKQKAQETAAETPKSFKEHEKTVLEQANAEASSSTQTVTEEMHTGRSDVLTQVAGDQQNAKGEDEKKRAVVASHVQQIYAKTKSAVESRLASLDGEAINAFKKGAAAAKDAYTSFVDSRMKAYKDDRYDGITGAALWLKDKLLGMPSEVNGFFTQGRELYLAKMDAAIDAVVNVVETGLNEAKTIIADGKKEIHEYVGGLDPSLQEVGKQAAEQIDGKFSTLEQSVDSKRDALIDDLATQYNQNLQEIDADLEKRKQETKGAVQKAVGAIVSVAKKILQLKNLLLNVLGGAASVITTIVTDPIKFLSNLGDGIKQGFNAFVGKIDEHLKTGLIGWLTGSIASAGIQMPEKLDPKGILSLVMQVLGLTWDAVRALAVKTLGEKVVGRLEKTFEIFQIVATEGLGGLWQFVKDKVGDLQAMVMDKIREILVTQVIKAGIKWLLSMLNPAAAFVKAAMAIYNVIKFIMNQGKQILEFANSIISSVGEIAKGNVRGAAKKVEESLIKSVPVAIGFFASVLGLGGIADKVKALFDVVQKPIKKAIGWVLGQAKAFAMKMGDKLGLGKGDTEKMKKGEGGTASVPHDKQVKAGLYAIDMYEEKFSDGKGKISLTNATKLAKIVKSEHPVFKDIRVVDGGDSWDYEYAASPKVVKDGSLKLGPKPTAYQDLGNTHRGDPDATLADNQEKVANKGLDPNVLKKIVVEEIFSKSKHFPVKVLQQRESEVKGYITTLSSIKNQTPDSIKDRLGLPWAEKDIYVALIDKPSVDNFALRADSRFPGGKDAPTSRYNQIADAYERGNKITEKDIYPKGPGTRQWELLRKVPVKQIVLVKHGEQFTGF